MDQRYWRHPLPFIVMFVMVGFYFKLPELAKWISLNSGATSYTPTDFKLLISDIQKSLIYPFGDLLNYGQRTFFVIFYWMIIGILIRIAHVHTGIVWRYLVGISIAALICLYVLPNTLLHLDDKVESIAIGQPANGSIESGKRMDYYGDNFSTYSFIGYLFGRTFVHSKVRNILLDTYKICETTCPGVSFVHGEMSWKNGGKFLAHDGHENGLSVDFMVPLLKEGKPYQNSRHILNLWGYALDFDMKGTYKNLEIDFKSMARHLATLDSVARKEGMEIQRIIFDPSLKPYLLSASSGKTNLRDLPFVETSKAIGVDSYYHVDFRIKQFSEE